MLHLPRYNINIKINITLNKRASSSARFININCPKYNNNISNVFNNNSANGLDSIYGADTNRAYLHKTNKFKYVLTNKRLININSNPINITIPVSNKYNLIRNYNITQSNVESANSFNRKYNISKTITLPYTHVYAQYP